MSRPYVLGRDEGEAIWFLGNLVTVKVAGEHTSGRLSLSEFVNPPGFAPPLHRHLDADEIAYVISGTARYTCGGETFTAGPGDVVLLPVGLPHTFTVGPDEPLRSLVITTPAGFERFVADVGEPAAERRLPDPGPVDVAALAEAHARHALELLGPPGATP